MSRQAGLGKTGHTAIPAGDEDEERSARGAVDVLVGLVEDAHGRVLVNRRRPGTHMEGLWEFPGGKRSAHESRFAALARELHEELGIDVSEAEPLLTLVHDYPDKRVALDVWLVTAYEGVPYAREGQEIRWAAAGDLAGLSLLPADGPIVEALLERSRLTPGEA